MEQATGDTYALMFIYYFYFMCVSVLPVCLSVYCVHTRPSEARRGHRSLGTEILESQTVLNHHVGAVNQNWVH